MALAVLAGSLIAAVVLVKNSQEIRGKALGPKITPAPTSLPTFPYTIEKIFGQPDDKQTMTNRIVANRGFHQGGVHLDSQDRIYIVDSGNNRILGFSSYQGPDQNADIVIGQPQLTDTGASNTDNTKYLLPSASTLSLVQYPAVISTSESPRFLQLATDSDNNLYVPDLNNNRVLKYNDPFNTDQIADEVWGQPDFTSRQAHCNQPNYPVDNQSFCMEYGSIFSGTGEQVFGAAVDIDTTGNLWVTDTGNHRVLRFSKQPDGTISKTADLVLGQPDFTTRNLADCWYGDANLSKMWKPLGVKVHPESGEVYVLDGQEPGQTNRILVFTPPFITGMPASREFGRAQYQANQPEDTTNWIQTPDCAGGNMWVHLTTGLNLGRGLALNQVAPGYLWVNDANNNRMLLYTSAGNMKDIIGQTNFDSRNCDGPGTGYQQPDGTRGPLCQNYGEIGVDSQGRLYSGKTYFYRDISAFPIPLQRNADGLVVADRWLLHASDTGGGWNQFSGKTFQGAYGLSLSLSSDSAPQLFVSDCQRVMVWNNFQDAITYQPADYFVGQDTGDTNCNNGAGVFTGNTFVNVQTVGGGYLWVASVAGKIFAFTLPILSGGTGYDWDKYLWSGQYEVGNVYWTDDGTKVNFQEAGLVFDPTQDALWVSDIANNRVLRISDPDGEAKVNLVLGQPDKSSAGDNAGQTQPNAYGFAHPWALNFDKLGNLYVVDSKYEGGGNNRVLRFNASDLIPQPGNIFPLPSASGVYAKQNFNTGDPNDWWGPGTPQSPTWVGFDSQNKMIMLVDSYGNDQYERVFIYPSTHASETTPQPTNIIPLALGQGAFAYFYPDDNHLIVQDLTWNRLLFLNTNPEVSPTPTPPDPTPTPTPTPTPIPTPTPLLRNGSFETDANNDNRPDQWNAKNLDENDILDTNTVYDGIRSFKFSPAATLKEQLLQALNYTGGGDEEIRLEVYNQSDGQVTIGKAGVILTVTYADGRKETSSGVFPYAAHSWKKKTLVIVSDEPYSQIKVSFFNTNQDTNVRIDASSLSVIPGAQGRGVKQTGHELPPKELELFQI